MERGTLFITKCLTASLAIALCSVLFSPVVVGAGPYWSMLDGDKTHSGASSMNVTERSPSLVWDLEPTGSNLRDGYTHWTSTTPLVGSDGTIYVASDLGNVSAVSPDGKLIWAKELGGSCYLGPVLSPSGSIIVATELVPHENISKIWSIAANGTVEWNLSVIGSSPMLNIDSNGSIFAALMVPNETSFNGYNGTVVAISRDGSLLWRTDLIEGWTMPPVLSSDDDLYVQISSTLFSFAQDGSINWKFVASGNPMKNVTNPIATIDGSIEFTLDGSLYRVASNGTMIWKYDLPAEFNSVVSLVYDPRTDATFISLSRDLIRVDENGTAVFDAPINWFSLCYHPIMSENGQIIYFTGTEMRSYSAINGTLLWKGASIDSRTCSGSSGIAIGLNGTMYVTIDSQVTNSLHLLAFNFVDKKNGDNGMGALLAISLVGLVILVASMVLLMFLIRRQNQ